MGECRVQNFSRRDLEKAAEAIEIDPDKYPALLEGMNIELEHCDISNGDPILTARIALAHLNETPDYYTKLKGAGL